MHLRCSNRRMKMGHTVRRTLQAELVPPVRRTFPQAAIFKGGSVHPSWKGPAKSCLDINGLAPSWKEFRAAGVCYELW